MAVVDVERHHQDLVDELIADVEAYYPGVDKELVARAFQFAAARTRARCAARASPSSTTRGRRPRSVRELRLDEQSIAAALLHDVVEDSAVDLDEIRAEFGDEIATLVEGVTKLTRTTFQSREQAEAENYRKMIVAMAQDVRVILIKLADRLHNMRTIEYQGKQTQVGRRRRRSRSTRRSRTGSVSTRSSGSSRTSRSRSCTRASTPRSARWSPTGAPTARPRWPRPGVLLQAELDKVDIPAEISGRAKHFYSIYDKMAKKGREFNEIYDLTAMRVIVERGGRRGHARLLRRARAHPLALEADAGPLQGLRRDAEVQPLPLAPHDGYRAGGHAARDPGPDAGDARGGRVRDRGALGLQERQGRKTDDEWLAWVKSLMDWQQDEADPREFMKTFRTDLFDDEVYVFTPKGEVKTLPAGATPIDFAYAVHTDVGHKTVGAKINGRIVPLHYRLKNGDFVEILTSKSGRGPSRDWMSLAASSRARNKIRQWFQRETRGETEAKGREIARQRAEGAEPARTASCRAPPCSRR